uniref:TIR domain-containing protein n=1 Tax=Candidatus Kentrum sp. SD TaxID=2126332 RepID=A0A451BN38_9GAMM|nr:MAG: TIR domain-containing protein [Candidatus Kentron sp. SD]
MIRDVFISHATEEKSVASNIKRRLGEAGIECFLSAEDLPGGMRWRDVIEHAIRESRVFLPVCSRNAIKSDWVSDELMVAKNHGREVVAFRTENVETHPLFHSGEGRVIDGFTDLDHGIGLLIQNIEAILSEKPASKNFPIPTIKKSDNSFHIVDEMEETHDIPLYIEEFISKPITTDQAIWWKNIHYILTKSFPDIKGVHDKYQELSSNGSGHINSRAEIEHYLLELSNTIQSDLANLRIVQGKLIINDTASSWYVIERLPLCYRTLSQYIHIVNDDAEFGKAQRLNNHLWHWVCKLNTIADSVILGYLTQKSSAMQ